jgi:hypothetical protein
MSRLLTPGILRGQYTASSLIADIVGDGAYAYSLDIVVAAYEGNNVIEVYNQTTASTTYIGTVNGVLDTATLLSFAGANTVTVRRIYDQLEGPAFYQPTTAQQPIIVDSGTLVTIHGKPAVYFDGVNHYMYTETAISTIVQPVTYACVFKFDKTTSKAITYVTQDNSTATHRHIPVYAANSGRWRSYFYNTSVDWGYRNTSTNIFVGTFVAGSVNVYFNKTYLLSAGSVGTCDSQGTLYLGAANTLATKSKFYFSELLAFSGNKVGFRDDLYANLSTRYAGTYGLKAGLVSCFELQETSGSTITDSAQDGFHCTAVNTPTLGASGKIGNAIEFNGTNEYLRYPNLATGSSVLSPKQEISVSAWVYRLGNSVDATEAIASRYFASNGYRDWIVGIEQSDKSLRWHYQDSALTHNLLYYYPGSDIWTNNWVHVVCTRFGASMKIYINGVLEASNTLGNGLSSAADSSSNATFNIGNVARSATTPDLYFYGRLEQVAVWNRELTQADVDNLYNSGAGRAYSSW